MSDLISRSALINDFDRLSEYSAYIHHVVIKELIETAPTVEARPSGEWIEVNDEADYDDTYECSECGKWFVLMYGTPEENNYNFCPNCGADMRKKVE